MKKEWTLGVLLVTAESKYRWNTITTRYGSTYKTKTPTMDIKVNRRGRSADNYKPSKLHEFKSRMNNKRTRMMTALQKN